MKTKSTHWKWNDLSRLSFGYLIPVFFFPVAYNVKSFLTDVQHSARNDEKKKLPILLPMSRV